MFPLWGVFSVDNTDWFFESYRKKYAPDRLPALKVGFCTSQSMSVSFQLDLSSVMCIQVSCGTFILPSLDLDELVLNQTNLHPGSSDPAVTAAVASALR